jgi:hypothetical protein
MRPWPRVWLVGLFIVARRTRGGIVTGSRSRVICTMVEPPAGGDPVRCLELVGRDRPDPNG